jgi:hypothetical protein
MSKQLYTYKCLECRKTFRTDNPEQKVCSDCLKFRKPHNKSRKKKTVKKPLTFAQILHIAEVYNKINGKYLHYGDMVKLIEENPHHCICCGAATDDKPICDKCEGR